MEAMLKTVDIEWEEKSADTLSADARLQAVTSLVQNFGLATSGTHGDESATIRKR